MDSDARGARRPSESDARAARQSLATVLRTIAGAVGRRNAVRVGQAKDEKAARSSPSVAWRTVGLSWTCRFARGICMRDMRGLVASALLLFAASAFGTAELLPPAMKYGARIAPSATSPPAAAKKATTSVACGSSKSASGAVPRRWTWLGSRLATRWWCARPRRRPSRCGRPNCPRSSRAGKIGAGRSTTAPRTATGRPTAATSARANTRPLPALTTESVKQLRVGLDLGGVRQPPRRGPRKDAGPVHGDAVGGGRQVVHSHLLFGCASARRHYRRSALDPTTPAPATARDRRSSASPAAASRTTATANASACCCSPATAG